MPNSIGAGQVTPISHAYIAPPPIPTLVVNNENGIGVSLTNVTIEKEFNGEFMYVPLRAVVEWMGGIVDWDAKNQEGQVWFGNYGTEKNPITFQGIMKEGNKLYVKVKSIAEKLGLQLGWNQAKRTATLNYKTLTAEQKLKQNVNYFMAKVYIADVVLTTGGNKAVDTASDWFLNAKYSHAAIYVGGGEIIGMVKSGLVKDSVEKFLREHADVDIYRYTAIQKDIDLRNFIADYAKKAFEKKLFKDEYDWSNLLGVTKPSQDEAICSEFVWQVYDEYKIQLTPDHKTKVYRGRSPSDYVTVDFVMYPGTLVGLVPEVSSKLTFIAHTRGLKG
ncbi:hypothetical protein FDZ74_11590, partial [bacterium]